MFDPLFARGVEVPPELRPAGDDCRHDGLAAHIADPLPCGEPDTRVEEPLHLVAELRPDTAFAGAGAEHPEGPHEVGQGVAEGEDRGSGSHRFRADPGEQQARVACRTGGRRRPWPSW